MAYDLTLAERVREYLAKFPKLKMEEKKMFSGLTFMVNGKMCICVTGENLMCRFDPVLTSKIVVKKGVLPVIMKGKEYPGYCSVEPTGFKSQKDFEFWVHLCLDFNGKAKSSTK